MKVQYFLVVFLLMFSFSCKSTHNQKRVADQVEHKGDQVPRDVPEKTMAPQELHCELGEYRRELKNLRQDDGGCRVIYTRDDEKQTVAEADNDLSHCDRVINNIRSNLEEAGFECRSRF